MKSPSVLPKRLAEGAAALLLAVGLISTVPTAEAALETAPRGSTETQLKGFEVAARSDRSDRGFGDSEVELTMVLRNSAGKETQRRLTITTLEVPDESVGDQSLVMFSTPRDIAGTALLSHARILDPDDQWLYLPALKRVKRISSANKSGPFVGSEFAFEDFTSLELNKYDYEWIREEVAARGEMRGIHLRRCGAPPALRELRLHPPGVVDRPRGPPDPQGGVLRPSGRPAQDPRA